MNALKNSIKQRKKLTKILTKLTKILTKLTKYQLKNELYQLFKKCPKSRINNQHRACN